MRQAMLCHVGSHVRAADQTLVQVSSGSTKTIQPSNPMLSLSHVAQANLRWHTRICGAPTIVCSSACTSTYASCSRSHATCASRSPTPLWEVPIAQSILLPHDPHRSWASFNLEPAQLECKLPQATAGTKQTYSHAASASLPYLPCDAHAAAGAPCTRTTLRRRPPPAAWQPACRALAR